MNNSFMLEYLPGTSKNPYITLHNNLCSNGKFDAELESNGWRSLALFPDDARASKKFLNLCACIHDQHLSFEDARELAQAVAKTF